MNVFDWLTGHFSNRGKALSLYKRGIAREKKHNHKGAIDDFTATIALPDTPPDLIAMALYHRSMVYVATGNDPKGVDDLNAVLAMDAVLAVDGALVNVKTMARQKLARMESRSRESTV